MFNEGDNVILTLDTWNGLAKNLKKDNLPKDSPVFQITWKMNKYGIIYYRCYLSGVGSSWFCDYQVLKAPYIPKAL